jgi:hypothetical protein
MCCFAGDAAPIVSNTRIFAATNGEAATLVYSLRLSARSDVAMILPLPVREGSGESALSFVSLEGYPMFFDALEAGFRRPRALSFGGPVAARGRAPLAVQAVGAFEASFVPRLGDFGRLDPRFRLSDRVWHKLPEYADYGFAVFRMAPGADKSIHPMAFRFPTRHAGKIFFPTVHVHDGEVHARARFDHSLFYQTSSERGALAGEEVSYDVASEFLFVPWAETVASMDRVVYRRRLVGDLPNRDFFVIESATRAADLYQH